MKIKYENRLVYKAKICIFKQTVEIYVIFTGVNNSVLKNVVDLYNLILAKNNYQQY